LYGHLTARERNENILNLQIRVKGSMSSNQQPEPDPDRLEAATDQAIAACGGDARDAVKTLIVANEFLEAQVEQLKADVSSGYARGYYHGRFKTYTG
jgi:hypothetical protein